MKRGSGKTRNRVSSEALCSMVLDEDRPQRVIQVGIGRWYERHVLEKHFPSEKTEYIGIEPLEKYQQQATYPGKVHQCAAWHEEAQLDLYVRSQTTSAMPVIRRQTQSNWQSFPAKRLDSLIEPGKRTLLWADCEGSELNAFRGAGALWKDVLWVICELTQRPKHGDWPSAEEVISFLVDKGFNVSLQIGTMWGRNFCTNALFIKRDEVRLAEITG